MSQTMYLGMMWLLLFYSSWLMSSEPSNLTRRTPIHAAFGYENHPKVVAAYQKFLQQGVPASIEKEGVRTLMYDSYAHPIIGCAPLHLCVVQLEIGEVINHIDLGDAAHWFISTSWVGPKEHGSYQVVIKPKLYDLVTDILITTNRRTYNLGLVSQKGFHTRILNFYYPKNVFSPDSKSNSMQPDQVQDVVNHLNFDYEIRGGHPVWRPLRAFDDGHRTWIQMPQRVNRLDLPVLFLVQSGMLSVVNYRFQYPYYVINQLVNKAALIAGVGRQRVAVLIVCKHCLPWGVENQKNDE